MLPFDPYTVPSPCYVIDVDALAANAEVFGDIGRRSGAKILLSLKAYAAFGTFDVLREHFDGTSSSSPFEAQLGAEKFGGETHVYSPAFSEAVRAALAHATSLTFNSIGQWHRFRDLVQSAPTGPLCGLRVNPERSSSPAEKYDPCGRGSRFGERAENLEGADLSGLSGLALHALCGADSHAFELLLRAFEERFGKHLGDLSWVNFGGGHMATRAGYDVGHICQLLRTFGAKFGVQTFIEPGEAVGHNAGFLVATVLDIVDSRIPTAILDASATAHAPDVLEMPYQPEVVGASMSPDAHPYPYVLGGQSCLASDVFGTYSFRRPLSVGTRIAFTDMAHYSMVKNNTFNGIALPSIAYCSRAAGMKVQKEFGYTDFLHRLS